MTSPFRPLIRRELTRRPAPVAVQEIRVQGLIASTRLQSKIHMTCIQDNSIALETVRKLPRQPSILRQALTKREPVGRFNKQSRTQKSLTMLDPKG